MVYAQKAGKKPCKNAEIRVLSKGFWYLRNGDFMDLRLKKSGIGAACIISVLLLAVLSGIIPYGAVIFPVVASSLTAYICIRCGKVATAINAVITVSALLLLTKNIESLIIAALCIVPGLVSGIMICRKKEYYTTLFGVCASFVAIIIGIMLWAGYGVENGIGGLLDASIQNMRESLIVAVPKENIADFDSMLSVVAAYIKIMLPSFVILFSLAFGYFHMVILRVLAGRISKIRYSYVPFNMHKTPKHMSYMYFILTIFVMFMSGDSEIGVALNNIVVIIDFILAFCGFSFIEYLLSGRIKYGFVRALIYITAFVIGSSLVIQILSIVGMLDSFVNYRRIERNGE